jgi:hypothetical protein
MPFARGLENLPPFPERGLSKLRASDVVRFISVYQGKPNELRQHLAGHFEVSVRTIQRFLPRLERTGFLTGSARGSSHVRVYELTPQARSFLQHPDGLLVGASKINEYFFSRWRELRKTRADRPL